MRLYYSHSLNPRVAVAVARYLQSPLEYVRASPRHPDQIEGFRLINPNALVPVLADGANTLWETDAIACRPSEMAGIGRPAAPEWGGRTVASSKPFNKFSCRSCVVVLYLFSCRLPGGDRRADRRSFEPRRFGRRDRGARVPDGKTESPGNGAATA